MRCSVLQCVAVCCSVLQCVAVEQNAPHTRHDTQRQSRVRHWTHKTVRTATHCNMTAAGRYCKVSCVVIVGCRFLRKAGFLRKDSYIVIVYCAFAGFWGAVAESEGEQRRLEIEVSAMRLERETRRADEEAATLESLHLREQVGRVRQGVLFCGSVCSV